MVKDVFLFLPDAIRRKTKKKQKTLTVEKLSFTQMLRHAGRQQRLFMFSFHGEKCSPRTQKWGWSRETSRGLTGRQASEGANGSHFFCLGSVSDMRSGECRLTHQLSVAAGGGEAPPQVFMCCNIGHMCWTHGPQLQSDLWCRLKRPARAERLYDSKWNFSAFADQAVHLPQCTVMSVFSQAQLK